MWPGKQYRKSHVKRSCVMGFWGHTHGHRDLLGNPAAELPCSPSAGILGALLVVVLCPSPAVSQISSWPSTPCQDPPLSVEKRDFILKICSKSQEPLFLPTAWGTSCALEWGDPDGIQTSPGTQGTCTCRERLGMAECPCSGRAWRRNLPGFGHNL